MEVVGELLLSAAFEALFHKLASSDFLTFARQELIHSQLKTWNTQLLNIREVLNDAEDKQITSSSVKLWLSDLTNLAYDIEDILDDFNTEMLRRKLSAQPQEAASTSTSRKVWSLIPSCCTSFTPSHVTFNVSMGSKIKDITDRLEDISTRKAQLGLEKVAGKTNSTWKRTPTTCLFDEPQTHGRDDDKNKILDLLLSDEPLAVIPIIGMGGLGKTTLARLVYNDDAVVKHFTPRAWVCVSDEFDVVKLTKAILSAISPQSSNDANDFNQLQVQLSQSLAGKRFLLVLDDVWNRNYEDWNNLRSPFRGGAKGSKIIVTTRNTQVALMMEPSVTYHHSLKPLSYDDCWSIFVQHAFENRNIQQHSNLTSIGKKIVEKCDGLPLAAKVLGGLLRSKQQDDEWEDVLNSKIWSSSATGIIPALRLSYHHLPAQLKRCFVYCAIFPQDYEFEETDLVLLWMAEGLIQVQPSEGNKQMEDLGAEYFRELVSRSFLMQSENGESQFVMHDLISDLAKSVAGQLFLHLENELEHNKNYINLQDTRHVSYNRCYFEIFKRFEALKVAKKLRTFIALPVSVYPNLYERRYLTRKVSCYLLLKLRYLRVLSMCGYNIQELPNSIGELKHLRYLNLSQTLIEWLPESIGELYNLQALILRGCDSLTTLPMSIGNLVNLRHLDISDTRQLKKMPPGIGNLINLQTLSKFIVEKDNSSSGIKELKKLSNIRGILSILGLHNVVDAQDAMDLNLKEKGKIEELTMEWGSDNTDDPQTQRKEMQILESLQPHRNLKKLTISSYGGGTFPGWIGNPSFSQMVQLYLKDCRSCTVLPSLGQLSSLKSLRIEGMSGIKDIGAEFYGQIAESFQTLECLTFSDMPEWEDWRFPSSLDEQGSLFPRLCELKMWRCPKFVGKLPCSLSFLVKLQIVECPKLSNPLPKCSSLLELNVEACNGMLLGSNGLKNFTSLVTLKMKKISDLNHVGERFVEGLTAMEDLSIKDCEELRWLRLETLGRLKRLKVLRCDGLISLEVKALPCNLEYLKIEGCTNLEKLPNELQSLKSLIELIISKCPNLVKILEKGWPPMLRELVVRDCEDLKSLPKGELPISLKKLSIYFCENVETLPEGIMGSTCNLEELLIEGCSSLTSFPSGLFPSTLKSLSIYRCGNLKLLPLDHMHNLASLEIDTCEGLEFQQHHMQNLTSLGNLWISKCPGLVSFPEGGLRFALNLISLSIEECENLRTPLSQWGLECLTSLKNLAITRGGGGGGYKNVVSFSDDDDCRLPLPSSLEWLTIGKFHNLESIASLHLHVLISLKYLIIHDCPKLQQFLPKEGLPATLTYLFIWGCPILEKRCMKDRGQDWPHIAHIPRISLGLP